MLFLCPKGIKLQIFTWQHFIWHNVLKISQKIWNPWVPMSEKLTMHNYICQKKADSSPVKKRPKASLHPKFLEPHKCHLSMRQLSEKGECWPKEIKRIIGAATENTPLQEELTSNYVYKKWRDSPAPLKKKAFKVDNYCSLWMTCPNINLWFDGSKRTLIQHGLKKRQAAAGERHWWWP